MSFKRLEPESELEWLQLRQSVLTATDMGIILGLNKYQSVKDVLDKKRKIEPIDNGYMWLGQQLEPVVVQAVNRLMKTNYELFTGSAFYVDEELGLGATPDAGDGDVLLECKSTKPANALRWAYWPPAYYLMQLYTQMFCCERNEGVLAILGTDLSQTSPELKLNLNVFKIKRDERIDDILTKEVKRFWEFQKEDKTFRVDRKQSVMLECMLYCLVEKVYP